VNLQAHLIELRDLLLQRLDGGFARLGHQFHAYRANQEHRHSGGQQNNLSHGMNLQIGVL
jgi:hypothetical protein